jgi:pimeloyl-ACP methyl ester carboxylesterase
MLPLVPLNEPGPVDVDVAESGDGRPILLLHGGAGPQSVAGFAQALATSAHARVLTPTHPGFGGTPRPAWLSSIRELAAFYRALLDELDLTDVVVIGNSVGGWIAAELALLGSPRISGVVLVDAVGVAVPGQPVADVFALSPAELSALSYHDPDAFRIDPAALTEAQQASMAANLATLRSYGGDMTDPELLGRLSAVTLPTLVVWGASDGVVSPEYGRAYAAAIPGARFALLRDTGHLPQIEDPEALLALVREFAAACAA